MKSSKIDKIIKDYTAKMAVRIVNEKDKYIKQFLINEMNDGLVKMNYIKRVCDSLTIFSYDREGL